MSIALTSDIADLAKENLSDFVFVDLREPQEVFFNPMNEFDCVKLPLSQYSKNDFQFDKDQKYILFCAKGARSLMLAEHLHGEGITNVTSLNGGIDAIKSYSHP